MSLCINPNCNHQNASNLLFCEHCGAELLLQGRYRATKTIGKGGFGQTYEICNRDETKVLKVLINNSSKAVDLFKREAEVLSKIDYPGIPKFDSYFSYQIKNSQASLHCLLMEKIEGLNLRQYIKQKGQPINSELALKWLQELLLIVNEIHSQGILHRDIKPDNIILDPYGKLFLIDFGAVKEGEISEGTEIATKTQKVTEAKTGTSIHSGGYTAREQMIGQARIESDIYSLGCTFVYLLTGKEPNSKENYDSYNDKIDWQKNASDITPQLAKVIDVMIAARASERPKNCQVILDDFLAEAVSNRRRNKANSVNSTNLDIEETISLTLEEMQYGAIKRLVINGKELNVKIPSGVKINQRIRLQGQGLTDYSNKRKGDLYLRIGVETQNHGNFEHFIDDLLSATVRCFVLKGHSKAVSSIAISKDGKTIVSGSADKTAKVWDLETKNLLLTIHVQPEGVLAKDLFNSVLNGDYPGVLSVAINNNATTIATGTNATTKVWNIKTGSLLYDLQSKSKGIFDHDKIIGSSSLGICKYSDSQELIFGTGILDGTTNHGFFIHVSDLKTSKLLRFFRSDGSFSMSLPLSVAISRDCQTIVSGNLNKTIAVWDFNTLKLLRTLKGHSKRVNTVAISENCQTIVSGSDDKTIKVWNLATGELLRTLEGHSKAVNTVAISENCQTIVSGSDDKTIKVWNLATGELLRTLKGHSKAVNTVAISENCQTIVSGSDDTEIRVWTDW